MGSSPGAQARGSPRSSLRLPCGARVVFLLKFLICGLERSWPHVPAPAGVTRQPVCSHETLLPDSPWDGTVSLLHFLPLTPGQLYSPTPPHCECVRARACVHRTSVWSSEDTSEESIVSFHHEDPKDRIQVVSLVRRCLCPLSHLTNTRPLWAVASPWHLSPSSPSPRSLNLFQILLPRDRCRDITCPSSISSGSSVRHHA